MGSGCCDCQSRISMQQQLQNSVHHICCIPPSQPSLYPLPPFLCHSLSLPSTFHLPFLSHKPPSHSAPPFWQITKSLCPRESPVSFPREGGSETPLTSGPPPFPAFLFTPPLRLPCSPFYPFLSSFPLLPSFARIFCPAADLHKPIRCNQNLTADGKADMRKRTSRQTDKHTERQANTKTYE